MPRLPACCANCIPCRPRNPETEKTPASLPTALHCPALPYPACWLQVDSEELQAVQRRLLEALLAAAPHAMYPAALCALADLKEVGGRGWLRAGWRRACG